MPAHFACSHSELVEISTDTYGWCPGPAFEFLLDKMKGGWAWWQMAILFRKALVMFCAMMFDSKAVLGWCGAPLYKRIFARITTTHVAAISVQVSIHASDAWGAHCSSSDKSVHDRRTQCHRVLLPVLHSAHHGVWYGLPCGACCLMALMSARNGFVLTQNAVSTCHFPLPGESRDLEQLTVWRTA